MEITDERLAELERLCVAASDPAGWTGSWNFHKLHPEEPDSFWVGYGCGAQHYPVRESNAAQWRKMMDQIQADGAFIAAARADVPELIAEIRRLRTDGAAPITR